MRRRLGFVELPSDSSPPARHAVGVDGVRRALIACAALLALSACRGLEKLEVAGVTREYRLALPAEQRTGSALVVYLHGHDDPSNPSPAEQRNREIVESESLRRGAAVLEPIGLAGLIASAPDIVGWGPGREAENRQFLARLIPDVAGKHGFDPRRVYLVGFASGADLVIDDAIRPWEPFVAGYAAFGAQLGKLEQPKGPIADRRYVFVAVGRRDRLIDGSNDVAVYIARRRPSAAVKYYTYDGGHELTREAVSASLEFLGLRAGGGAAPFKLPEQGSSRAPPEHGAAPPGGWESSPGTPLPGGGPAEPPPPRGGPGPAATPGDTMPGGDTTPGGPETPPPKEPGDTMPGGS